MAVEKDLFWTESARDDLKSIFDRLARRSPEEAKDLMELILSQCQALKSRPQMGDSVKLLQKEAEEYRSLSVGFYKVIYSIGEKEIMVKLIYHERQAPK